MQHHTLHSSFGLREIATALQYMPRSRKPWMAHSKFITLSFVPVRLPSHRFPCISGVQVYSRLPGTEPVSGVNFPGSLCEGISSACSWVLHRFIKKNEQLLDDSHICQSTLWNMRNWLALVLSVIGSVSAVVIHGYHDGSPTLFASGCDCDQVIVFAISAFVLLSDDFLPIEFVGVALSNAVTVRALRTFTQF